MQPFNNPYSPPLPGIDEAWDRATIDMLINVGVKFVCRYYSYGTSGKNLTRAEADQLAAGGLWIVSVWEYDPDAPLNGWDQGARDAAAATMSANRCDQPTGSVIYFACDRDFPTSQFPVIGQYFQGIATALGGDTWEPGAYAKYDLGKWLLDNGYIKWLWQPFAWSRGKWDPRAVIRQTVNGVNVGGHNVDDDVAEFSYYGQWQPGKLPSSKGGTMELSDLIPGTESPDHATPRNLQEILHDWALLRQYLTTGATNSPLPSWPITQLLAIPGQLANMSGVVAGLVTAVDNLRSDLVTLSAKMGADQVGRDLVTALSDMAIELSRLQPPPVPPVSAPTVGGTTG